MKNIVVFTGAGISAESGLKTFRASDGLWEEHRIEDVATPEAWRRDPELVLEFYNQRRRGETRPDHGVAGESSESARCGRHVKEAPVTRRRKGAPRGLRRGGERRR